MGWKETYNAKLKTMEEAVKCIKSGDKIVIGHAVGEPVKLVDTMVDYVVKSDLGDIQINQMVAMGHCLYGQPGMEKYFKVNSLFNGKGTRDAVNTGVGDFVPCFFYQAPDYWRYTNQPDYIFITVSKPDENGNCSYGVSCDYTKPVSEIEGCKVIACVNPNMPYALGNNFINVEDIDIIVEDDSAMPELPIAPLGEVEMAIGKNISTLINDGDCLQLGIGSIPDAVLKCLGDKKDLGIHSEMISDGVVDLVEAGVVTCKKKNFNPGKAVITFLMGTKRLYDFANNNEMVYMAPVDYVNNPMIIGQNDNLVSINSSIEVDLMGQACSEAMGLKQFSGIGGQVDFIRGAAFSKGGRAILAFPATAKKGAVSKIVPFLTHGAPVTTSRTDVDYVVTEYGIAKLKGNSLKERAKQLINVAAPQFREDLAGEYEERFHQKLN